MPGAAHACQPRQPLPRRPGCLRGALVLSWACMGGTPVRVFLARHGETVWNVEGRWQGQADSPLTERGLAQARSLARALADEPLAAVYSSDLGRALETARYVAEPHGLQPTPDARLREIDAGLWTGRLSAELRLAYPAEMELWRERPWAGRMPGGESLHEAQARCIAFFHERLPRHAGQAVAVISHGAVTQAILTYAMQRPIQDMWLPEGRVENCQISRLEWSEQAGPRLVELCDTRHLAQVGGLGSWRAAGDADEQVEQAHDPGTMAAARRDGQARRRACRSIR